MIKKLLDKIHKSVLSLNDILDFDLGELAAQKEILKLLEQDFEQLKRKNPRFLDGDQGYIDYYSPHVKAQLKNKQEIFEKYLTNLLILQATLCAIQQLELAKKALPNPRTAQDKIEEARLNREINILLNTKDPQVLAARVDVQKELEQIKEINLARKELKAVVSRLRLDDEEEPDDKMTGKERTDLEISKIALQAQITKFENETKEVVGFKTLQFEVNNLQVRLDKHLNLTKKIPTGMMDIKRALSFYPELTITRIRNQITQKELEIIGLAIDDAKVISLQRQITELKQKEAELKTITFSDSAEVNQQIKAMLSDLRTLMTGSIRGYQQLAIMGNDLNGYLHQTTGFYWENLFLFKKTLLAITTNIKNAAPLTDAGKEIALCLQNALDKVPADEVIKKGLSGVAAVDKNLQLRQATYERPPAKKSKEYSGFYRKESVELITEMVNSGTDPLFYIPYNSSNYALDHPAKEDLAGTLGNCYGETQMFLNRINSKNPSFNNICPETDLMNFHLDQSRTMGGTSRSTELGKAVADQSKKERINWALIKDTLTQPSASPKDGDICWLKFSGGRTSGFENDIGHAIGFIKMKTPNPYKYVVYDYSYGAMGFSTDAQLEQFFENILNRYIPFSKFVMEKVADVSDECNKFINGANGISPLQKADPKATCVRQYWNKERLLYLIKYSTGIETELALAVEKTKKLGSVEDKRAVYQALIANPGFKLERLLNLSISEANLVLMEQVLKQVGCLNKDIYYKSKTALSPKIEQELIILIENGSINPKAACNIFRSNLNIITAAFAKDPTSLAWANNAAVLKLVTTKKISAITALAAFPNDRDIIIAAFKAPITNPEALKSIDKATVLALMKSGAIKGTEACTVFNDDETIILSAYNKSKKNSAILQLADKDLIVKLVNENKLTAADLDKCCKAFSADENVISAVAKKKTSALQFADSDLVEKLVQNGEVNPKTVAQFFPHTVNLQQAAATATKLESMAPLTALPTEPSSYITELKALHSTQTNYPIKSFAGQIDSLVQNACLLLVAEITNHPAIAPSLVEQLVSAIRVSQGAELINIMDRLVAHKAQLSVEQAKVETRVDRPKVKQQKIEVQVAQPTVEPPSVLPVTSAEVDLRSQQRKINVLISFAKEVSSDHHLQQVLKKANELITEPADKERLYQALLSSKKIDLNKLFTLAINEQHVRLIEHLLTKGGVSYTEAKILPPVIVSLLDAMPAKAVPNAFPHLALNKGTLEGLKQHCILLLEEITAAKISPKDRLIDSYCQTQRKIIERSRDTTQLSKLLVDLRTMSDSVNSLEIKKINREIAHFGTVQPTFFTNTGCKKKIEALKEAIQQVPLKEREHVYSNTDNRYCTNVQKAIIELRRSAAPSMPVVDSPIDVSRPQF